MKRLIAIALFWGLVSAAALVQARATRTAVDATAAYARAGDATLALPARLESARRAAELRPDELAFRERAVSLEARTLTYAGDLDQARDLVFDAWYTDRGNGELRAQLAQIDALIQTRDARKAHVLHGREKPGGVLEPDDLMP